MWDASWAAGSGLMLAQVRCIHAQTHLSVLARLREGLHHIQHIRRPIMPRRQSESPRGCRAQDSIPLLPSLRRHVHIYQRELSPCTLDRFGPGDGQDPNISHAGTSSGGFSRETDCRWKKGGHAGQAGKPGRLFIHPGNRGCAGQCHKGHL